MVECAGSKKLELYIQVNLKSHVDVIGMKKFQKIEAGFVNAVGSELSNSILFVRRMGNLKRSGWGRDSL